MAIDDIRVIAWPFALASGENAIYCSDNAGTFSAQSLITTEMVTRGDGGVAPKDFIKELEAKLNAAYAVVYGAGAPITVAQQTDGDLVLASSAQLLKLHMTHANWTLDTLLMGFRGTADVTIPAVGTTLRSTYVAGCQWRPNRWHTWDTLDYVQRDVAAVRGPTRRPYYLCHHDEAAVPQLRQLAWPDIAAARVWQSWLNSLATAEERDGLASSDPNACLDNLLAYAVSGTGPSPREVYVLTTDDPGTLVVEGPYYLDLSDATLNGVAPGSATDAGRLAFTVGLGFVLV